MNPDIPELPEDVEHERDYWRTLVWLLVELEHRRITDDRRQKREANRRVANPQMGTKGLDS